MDEQGRCVTLGFREKNICWNWANKADRAREAG